jgi:hypothetical protein
MTPPGVTVIASVLALAAAAQAGQTGVVTPLFSSEDLGAWNREGADAEVQGPALLVREGAGLGPHGQNVPETSCCGSMHV